MEPNTMDCDTPTALRFLASSAKQAEAEWMRKAADEIERLVGLSAFASPDMVKWLTDQVMRRDNVIEAMKSAGMEQITKAFTENRWIPVSERMPDLVNSKDARYVTKERYSDPVLVFDGSEVHVGTYGDVEGWLSGYETLSSVTHWMALPAPPTDAK